MLVGYLAGDPLPVGIARLVRDGASAEIAFEVADDYQGRGSRLDPRPRARRRRTGGGDHEARGDGAAATTRARLAPDPRMAESLHVRWQGGEREIVARLEERTS